MGFLRTALRATAPICGLLLLSACSETVDPSLSGRAASADSPVRLVPTGYSPAPAAVAITEIEGAPDALLARFRSSFDAAAQKSDVTLADQSSARYLARGYLSAFLVEGGARLTYVFDIYDRKNHRAQRLNDEIALQGQATDPWALVEPAAVDALARRGAEALAAYLSYTPEAVAQNGQNSGQDAGAAVKAVARPAAAAPASTLSFAPTR